MIFACYPDYGKAPPEYAVNVIDVISTFPEWVMVDLCNLRTGIPAKCKFLPTVADIVRMGEDLIADQQLKDMVAEKEAEEYAKQKAADEHKVWWQGREAALVKARAKYPTAFLNPDGSLMYYPEREKVTKPKPKGEEKEYDLKDLIHAQPLGKWS